MRRKGEEARPTQSRMLRAMDNMRHMAERIGRGGRRVGLGAMWIDRCLMSHLEHLGDDDTTRMLYAVEVQWFDIIQHCNAGDATVRRVRLTLS